MTTGVPGSDPYADSGDRDWDLRPAVPGWTAGQDYTGPLFDDTGWHIDLSDVDWGGDAGRGNGAAPGTASYERPAEAPPGWTDKPGGRHARHARPDDEAQSGRSTRPPGARRRVAGQPPPRTQPRRAAPSAYQEPPAGESRPYGPADYAAPDYDPGNYPPLGHGPPAGPPRPAQPRGSRPPVYEEPGLPWQPPALARPRGAGPGQPPAGPGSRAAAAGGAPASIVRSSGLMAVGTLGSRLTGFLRTIVQSAVLGGAGIAAAYNLSNTLPNVVYNLALGGILTSVIVPLIVAAAKRNSDRGDGYDQRMFTLVTLVLLVVTVVATAAAVPIVHLYAGSSITRSPATLHLAVVFALFFIPQIFFYGVSSLIGAILNSRGSFAAPMWTPIVNNVVVIAVLALYLVLAGLHQQPGTLSAFEVGLLGLGTTVGIIAQTVALVPALRRAGFRWRPRTDFRRAEAAEIGRMGGWMFCYVAATQVAFLVTTRLAVDANIHGISEYNYAWLLFQLPYAVVGISVITALLPRMSAHASERRFGLVRQDFSAGVRLAATIVVPCSLVLAVLGPKLGELVLGHGDYGLANGRYTGVVFAVFCLGLLPYMIFQLQLRLFYSMHDSKTPATIGLVTMTVNIVTNLLARALLPPGAVVAGLGVGFGLANLAGLVIAWRILTRRLRGLDGYRIGRSLVRMHAATVPAALVAILVGLVTGSAVVVVIIGGGLAFGMYLLFARLLRIEELANVSRTVLSRLGR